MLDFMLESRRTFYQMPGDEQEFLAFLETTGDLLGMSYWAVDSREALTPKPLLQYITEDNPEYVVFGPRRHVQLAFDEGIQYVEKADSVQTKTK